MSCRPAIPTVHDCFLAIHTSSPKFYFLSVEFCAAGWCETEVSPAIDAEKNRKVCPERLTQPADHCLHFTSSTACYEKVLPGYSLASVNKSKIKLSSNDDIIGVKSIYYSINDGPQKIYRAPISISLLGENGKLSFYAVDYLNNKEESKVINSSELITN